jgi:hypothetical protein
MTGFTGVCLCGAVRYKSSEDATITGHCHCIDCRKSSGKGHGSYMGTLADALTLTVTLSFHGAPTDTSSTVTQNFHPTCGCAINSTNSAMEGMPFIRASSLDDSELFKPKVVVYTSRAPSWDKMDPNLLAFEKIPLVEAMLG